MDAKIYPKNYWGIRMEYKSFMEALKGKQHKIDKNKNGQIDAQDFKLLRKEETEELDEALDPSEIAGNPKMYDAATVKKAYYHNKTTPEDKKTLERHLDRHHGMRDWRNSVKEETEELEEIRRMKTKLNTLDDISNKSVARQKLSNLMKSGKARGALIANKMRTLNMGDDLDQEDLDALYEVLSKDAKAGDYISDFVHSTNPKFAGKSKKERINMALGAYYNTHKKKDGISEEAEELDEKSDQAKQNKTMKNMMSASKGAQVNRTLKLDPAEYGYKRAQHLNVAIGRQMMKSEATNTVVKDKTGKIISFKYEGDWKKTTKADAKKDPAGKVANMAGQAMQKMTKANEQAPVAPVPDRKYIKGTPEHKAYKATKKPINGMPTNKMTEEKDEQEYGYEGDMAMNQLSTLIRCAEMIKDTLKPDTDLPEWVQSKITLASDYIVTAADYLHSELEEGYYEKPASAYRRKGDEVGGGSSKAVSVKVNHAGDEPHEEKWEPVKKIKKPVEEAVQKADIPAYLRKAKGDTPLKMDDLKRKDTLSDAENLKRNRGVKESFDDEGNLISNKVSYKEFMLEYTPGPGGVTQIKGRSYGANYSDPEGADDADDNKPMKPAAEKRGRGRPAGAKSGARKITGTSKLMNK